MFRITKADKECIRLGSLRHGRYRLQGLVTRGIHAQASVYSIDISYY